MRSLSHSETTHGYVRRAPFSFVFLPLILLLAGCSGSFLGGNDRVVGDGNDRVVGGGYDRVVGRSGAWGVSVVKPRVDSLGECQDDPSVESAVLSMDMPSSGYGLRLVPGSAETDALRVADCLADAGAGKITINSPDE